MHRLSAYLFIGEESRVVSCTTRDCLSDQLQRFPLPHEISICFVPGLILQSLFVRKCEKISMIHTRRVGWSEAGRGGGRNDLLIRWNS